MTPVETILGGIVIAVSSGAVGKFMSDAKNVRESQCGERRKSCSKLLTEKIDTLTKSVDNLIEEVKCIRHGS